MDDPLILASRADWEAWLEERHDETPDGVWLALAKKGVDGLKQADALEVALCFGWIDTQVRRLDEQRYLQRFVPRRQRSRWSRINRDKAEALIASGAMRPAGLREVERSRADGRWEDAYEGQARATVPPDLQEALDADPQAAACFATLSSQNRYAIIFRLGALKRPETRARRIVQYVQMLREGRTLHP